jgi:hypothetical protein
MHLLGLPIVRSEAGSGGEKGVEVVLAADAMPFGLGGFEDVTVFDGVFVDWVALGEEG